MNNCHRLSQDLVISSIIYQQILQRRWHWSYMIPPHPNSINFLTSVTLLTAIHMRFQGLFISLGLSFLQLGASGFQGDTERSIDHAVAAPKELAASTPPTYRIPKLNIKSGIWMVPETGVRRGSVDFTNKQIYQTGEIACAEYKLMRKNFTVKLVSVGQVHRTHSRFSRQGQKFYIYPLNPLRRDKNGIYKPTPYVVIDKKCRVIAIYLRTFLKSKTRFRPKSKYDLCWEGRDIP